MEIILFIAFLFTVLLLSELLFVIMIGGSYILMYIINIIEKVLKKSYELILKLFE